MLPACRTADETFAIPQFALTQSDIDTFMDELRGFHTAFRACFARQEQARKAVWNPRSSSMNVSISLWVSDIDTYMDELRGFHTAFRACFARQEPRDQFFNYMVGQFSALERKSIEPMALRVEGGKVRAMQRLVSDALWDEDAMRETYHRLVCDEMGEDR